MASRFFAIGASAVMGIGVVCFSATGSTRAATYENAVPSFTTLSSSGSNAGEYLLNFDTTGATNTTALPATIPPIPPGGSVAVVLQWDPPNVTDTPASARASSSIDLCIRGATSTVTVTDYDGNAVSCTGPNAAGADPYQIMVIANPSTATGNSKLQTVDIVVGLAANSNGAQVPNRLRIAVEGGRIGNTVDALAMSATTAAAAPAAPTLTLAATTIQGPGSTEITWSSVNALHCTCSGNANTEALGSWIGTVGPSGEYTETPLNAGIYTFTLTCSNAVGTSPPTTATLTVTPSPNTGGGGALDGLMLLGLAALGFVRLLPPGKLSQRA